MDTSIPASKNKRGRPKSATSRNKNVGVRFNDDSLALIRAWYSSLYPEEFASTMSEIKKYGRPFPYAHVIRLMIEKELKSAGLS